jgi:hypothetical protein
MPATSVSYQNGKIYRIWSLLTDKIYIGSTADTLSNRFCSHKKSYKRWKNGKKELTSSFTLFEAVGIDNCKIDLEHNFPCNSKRELNREEGRVQRLHKHILINKCIAGRTDKEYHQDHKEESKQYYQEHKEEILDQKKQYYQEHKEERLDQNKQYYQEHKAQILEQIKQYREEHKIEISEKRKEKFICECGSNICHGGKSRHEKSLKHQAFITAQN